MDPLDPSRDALLLIDVQPDFMPGGPLAVAGGDEIVAPIARLLPRFSTVVATQDWHPPGHVSFGSTHGRAAFSTVPMYGATQTMWPDHCVQGTPGAELHPGLPDVALSVVVRKGANPKVDSYSAFTENVGPDGQRASTGLAALLRARGITRVFVCGLARDVCVAWSTLDAAAAGLRVVLLDDLCRAVDAGARVRTDTALREAGVEIASSMDLA